MRIEAYHYAGPADGSKPFITPRRAYACRLLLAQIVFVTGAGAKAPVPRLSIVDGEGNLTAQFAARLSSFMESKKVNVNWHPGAAMQAQDLTNSAAPSTFGEAEWFASVAIPSELWIPAGSRVRLEILDQVGPGSAAAIDWQTIDLAFLVPIASDFGR